MPFISKSDLNQDIYSEILSGITRGKDEKIETACNEAITEADGYLCGRYDTDHLFEQTESDRNKTVLSICRTIAIYNLHSVCNRMPELRMEEYKQAVKNLEKIQKGVITLKGAKLLGETEEGTPDTVIIVKSNPKRDNQF